MRLQNYLNHIVPFSFYVLVLLNACLFALHFEDFWQCIVIVGGSFVVSKGFLCHINRSWEFRCNSRRIFGSALWLQFEHLLKNHYVLVIEDVHAQILEIIGERFHDTRTALVAYSSNQWNVLNRAGEGDGDWIFRQLELLPSPDYIKVHNLKCNALVAKLDWLPCPNIYLIIDMNNAGFSMRIKNLWNLKILLRNFRQHNDFLLEAKSMTHDYSSPSSWPNWIKQLITNVVEREKAKIALDLHDSILQEQIHIFYQVERLINEKGSRRRDWHTELSCLHDDIRKVIDETRDLCLNWRPAHLEAGKLREAVELIVSNTEVRSGLAITLQWQCQVYLTEQQERTLYRVIQELLSNAVKHSYAQSIKLWLSADNSAIQLGYSDDGRGWNCEHGDNSSCIGLSGIEERVRSVGGEVHIQSGIGEGFHVVVRTPMQAPTASYHM
ncbi:hypothetical protein PSTEL_06140 [Paenibacillus stellifer]|uniref:Histidine kinase domain-containing protein n=1 Tax=Paenibacillus stellifer TaxID=169760 RepID=A0A089N219_9BACL|nr:ATP-binding protein [Paenibacillus stellifer]AIQ62744.1 hypothetical protein PSTEL_06140 [Paenibacillus stellifer]